MTETWEDEYAAGNEEFVEEIRRAFADSEYPGDDNIVITVPQHWESDEMEEDFKGKHWRDLSIPVLMSYRMNFTMFTPAGFQFYFPAFLIAILTNGDAADIAFFLSQTLVPPNEDDHGKFQRFKARLDGFTPEQLDVIRKYILSSVENDPIYASRDNTREKVERFWNSDVE